jgi:hypothetical protein
MWRGRLAVNRAEARRQNKEFAATVHGLAKKPLGHRAATDIAGANEQNRFHPT